MGLAVGVGLVVTVTAASAGVGNAEAAVLHSLYGVGTDVTVTTAAPTPNPGSTSKAGTSGSHQGFSPGKTPQHEDLLGYPPGLGALDASSVAFIDRLHGVSAAAGGLTLTDTKLTVPSLSQLGPNGQPPPGSAPVTFTVDGVDASHLGIGPFASAKIGAGRSFLTSDADSNVAVIDASYASASKLTVGLTVTIAHVSFKVIGIVHQPPGGGAADVYIPLGRAQALAGSPDGVPNSEGTVNIIYVTASSASDTPTVRNEISVLLPTATVTSASNLAGEVSGSLASAASLATDLGRWLAIAVLVAAFAVASLLTLAATARRVRELGTLKALGWRTRRVVGQLLGESLVIGILGALLGIALGFGGAALVDALAPRLTATVSQNPGSPLPRTSASTAVECTAP